MGTRKIVGIIAVIILALVSCASEIPDAFNGRELADMNYESLETNEVFVETTAKEAIEMMDSGETFALFFGFEDCPWCNMMIPQLQKAAKASNVHVGYVDTRKNPEWKTNMDIDDYDLFVDRFGPYLEKDDDGKLHLYVPTVYFIKNGKVVGVHENVLPEIDGPGILSLNQEEKLYNELVKKFDRMRG